MWQREELNLFSDPYTMLHLLIQKLGCSSTELEAFSIPTKMEQNCGEIHTSPSNLKVE